MLASILALFGCKPSSSSTTPAAAPSSWGKCTVLAAKEDHPSKVISDGTSVFFVTGGTVASEREGTNNIKRVDLQDGTVSVLVAGGKTTPRPALALDEQHLYWTDGGRILRVPKSGGESTVVAANARTLPSELAVDDRNIYWLAWTGEGTRPQPVMAAPKSGGDARQIAPPQYGANGICLEGAFLFWAAPAGIHRVAKDGGEPTIIYPSPKDKGATVGLGLDTENFYYAQLRESRGHSGLMKLPRNGGTPTLLAAPMVSVREFLVDATHVYFFADDGELAMLRRVAKTGGEVETLDRGKPGWLQYLAGDAAHVYFTDIARVYRLPKP
jgi:hypothetical protein